MSKYFYGESKMSLYVFFGIILPFIGTSLGAGVVFMTQNPLSQSANNSLSGFASGVMIAASIWSLIIPSVSMSENLGFFKFLPALFGIWSGLVFLLLCDKPMSKNASRKTLFYLSVVLHNIPEGMAVGLAFACANSKDASMGLTGAVMLSLGMALQNIPEGAIISLPLESGGVSKEKAFVLGSLSGIVEPVFALITIMFSSFFACFLPFFLGFAAGAMIFVTVTELIPEASGNTGVFSFFGGFSLMMVLDVALG